MGEEGKKEEAKKNKKKKNNNILTQFWALVVLFVFHH